jgi:hypothetical protein
LAWWRGLASGDWNLWPAAVCVTVAVCLVVSSTAVWWRRRDRVIATALWLPALVVLMAAAVMGVPAGRAPGMSCWPRGWLATAGAVLWQQLSAAPKEVLAW